MAAIRHLLVVKVATVNHRSTAFFVTREIRCKHVEPNKDWK